MLMRKHPRALRHIAVLGNALPRRCGLATYTSHSVEALRRTFPGATIDHYAMDDSSGLIYSDQLVSTIEASDVTAYARAARAIRESGAEILWIHHEFGIFGGSAGDYILNLLHHVEIPVAVTLHTVLREPNEDQMRVMRALEARADRLIVMTHAASEILQRTYGVPGRKVQVIPHGAPDRPFSSTLPFKRKLNLSEGPTVLTFGLLSPGKGIEIALQGLRTAVARHPDLRYLIVGATHPTLIRREGEAYRDSLNALVHELGLENSVEFVDRFLEDEDLLDYLQAADVYLTPYLNAEQVTSGTLSYALALGKRVISTPYIHAAEALANRRGTLVPFGDSGAIADAIIDHFADPAQLESDSQQVWMAARHTIWSENARSVMDVLGDAVSARPVSITQVSSDVEHRVNLLGVSAMTDDVGIIQHSVKGIPDRRHGYCIDDNARALMLVCQTRTGDPVKRKRLVMTYAAFVEHGWNEAAGSFRNFMSFDRRWLEEVGSEDSNGRTLWALGSASTTASEDWMREWARGLFKQALPLAEKLRSPRARAFVMLGMAMVLHAQPGQDRCRRLLNAGIASFKAAFARYQRPGWQWFEPVLAYDNARLPQALICAGRAVGDQAAVDLGVSTLEWLTKIQSAPEGHFRPVGTESFGEAFTVSSFFDQQPLEAAASVDACLAAYRATRDQKWPRAAQQAFAWFEGENDLGARIRTEDGSLCRDGLGRSGTSLNIGAESLLAFQMARHSMGEIAMLADDAPRLLVV
jgi:glycosyltransferase involved in cell wall biosynthesis